MLRLHHRCHFTTTIARETLILNPIISSVLACLVAVSIAAECIITTTRPGIHTILTLPSLGY